MKLVALFTLLLPLISFAYNPHHKLTIVLADLDSGQTSHKLVQTAKQAGLKQLLFHCFGSYEGICSQDYYISDETIYVHADFHGAPYPELKQLVREALSVYSGLE